MSSMSIRKILERLGKDHFYLMELRYGGDPSELSHKALWEFAKEKNLVGIDHPHDPDVNRDWADFPSHLKAQVSPWWNHQFDLFYSIREGDAILVPDGQTRLLGVAKAQGEPDFRLSLRAGFFRHVQRVKWLKAFEWDARPEFPLGLWLSGFRNTIQRIDKESGYWKIIDLKLELDREHQLTSQVDTEEPLPRKYGPGGEGINHRRLKEWILNNPESIGLVDVIKKHQEYEFITGDRADLVFDLTGRRHAVVEIETDNPKSIAVGAFQALKYKVLKCAEENVDITSDKVSSILVAWNEPDDLRFCREYGIRFVKKKR